MATLEDKYSAIETIYKLSYAIDKLNYAETAEMFYPDRTFNFDIYAILKTPPKDITVLQYFDTASHALGGFDATEHIVSNPIVSVNDDGTVHVKVMVTAFHGFVESTGVEGVTARVTWNIDLERSGDRWLIVKWRIAGLMPMDRPDLFEKGHKRGQEGKLRASIVGP